MDQTSISKMIDEAKAKSIFEHAWIKRLQEYGGYVRMVYRLQQARRRLQKEREEFDRVRQRRDYWAKIVSDIETRLKVLDSGQTEFEI